MKKVIYKDFQNIPYKDAWELQTKVHQALIENKQSRRSNPDLDLLHHEIIFCEHNPPVYTLGKSGSMDHLLLNEAQLKEKNIDFFKINRGGDITYHGPGQITGYPIFDMDFIYSDIHRYVRDLEESIIQTLLHYDIKGTRIEGYTGVWIQKKNENEVNRKICAIGVHLSRWVTLHGFALNVNTDLSYFNNIIPCGIADEDKSVTSISKELGKAVDINEIKALLLSKIIEIFDLDLVVKS